MNKATGALGVPSALFFETSPQSDRRDLIQSSYLNDIDSETP